MEKPGPIRTCVDSKPTSSRLRGYPLQHSLIFCQFVESDPKGLGLKYLAGWMLFSGVIKIEKMHFSNYCDACDDSSSYLASRSYEALEKNIVHEKLFVGSTSTG